MLSFSSVLKIFSFFFSLSRQGSFRSGKERGENGGKMSTVCYCTAATAERGGRL